MRLFRRFLSIPGLVCLPWKCPGERAGCSRRSTESATSRRGNEDDNDSEQDGEDKEDTGGLADGEWIIQRYRGGVRIGRTAARSQ